MTSMDAGSIRFRPTGIRTLAAGGREEEFGGVDDRANAFLNSTAMARAHLRRGRRDEAIRLLNEHFNDQFHLVSEYLGAMMP